MPESTSLILRLSVMEWLEDAMPESGTVEMAKRMAGLGRGRWHWRGPDGHRPDRPPVPARAGMGAACCRCIGRQIAVAGLVSAGEVSGWREH